MRYDYYLFIIVLQSYLKDDRDRQTQQREMKQQADIRLGNHTEKNAGSECIDPLIIRNL